MIDIITLLLLTAVTVLALVNAIGLVTVINRGLTMDKEGFKKFNKAMLLIIGGLLLLSIGHIAGLLKQPTTIGGTMQLVGTLSFVYAMSILAKIPSSGKGSLSAEWGELEKEIQATKLMPNPRSKTMGLINAAEGKNLILAEVTSGGVLPVFDQITSECKANKVVFPMLGIISPYDLKNMWGELGEKGGMWITASETKDEWINKKFLVAKPSETYQVNTYIRLVLKKYPNKVAFIGDFIDEMHPVLGEAKLQTMLSKMKTLLQQKNALMFVIVDKGVHKPEEIQLLERYADAKLSFEENKVVFKDFKTNQEKIL